MHNGGYLHPLNGKRVELPPPEPEKPSINCTAIMRDLWRKTTDTQRSELAERLGVSLFAVRCVGACWHPAFDAWAFPMMDAFGCIVGIRLRNNSGRKWAVCGSRQGIFIPVHFPPQPLVYVMEGPTDLSAALTIGLFAIGRPSCSGAVEQTAQAIQRFRCQRAVLISDNDNAGSTGARTLAERLHIPSCITVLPAKDMREFVRMGGTSELLESLTNSLVWNQPKSSARV